MENCRLRKLVENFRELYTTFHQMLSIKNFSKCEHLFRKVELFFFNTEISFSQGKFLLADCEVLAYAHEPWELVPLDELCKAEAILAAEKDCFST